MLSCLLLQAGEAAITEAQPVTRTLVAESYLPRNPGPYPQDKPPENQVRFTPVQVRTLNPKPFRDSLPKEVSQKSVTVLKGL